MVDGLDVWDRQSLPWLQLRDHFSTGAFGERNAPRAILLDSENPSRGREWIETSFIEGGLYWPADRKSKARGSVTPGTGRRMRGQGWWTAPTIHDDKGETRTIRWWDLDSDPGAANAEIIKSPELWPRTGHPDPTPKPRPRSGVKRPTAQGLKLNHVVTHDLYRGQRGLTVSMGEHSDQEAVLFPAWQGALAFQGDIERGDRAFALKDEKPDKDRTALLSSGLHVWDTIDDQAAVAWNITENEDGTGWGYVVGQTGHGDPLLGYASYEKGGPWWVPPKSDQHHIKDTKRLKIPVGSVHITTKALFIDEDGPGDGPLEFGGIYPKDVARGMFPYETTLAWDPRVKHDWFMGPKDGKWRWYTKLPFYIPPIEKPRWTPPWDPGPTEDPGPTGGKKKRPPREKTGSPQKDDTIGGGKGKKKQPPKWWTPLPKWVPWSPGGITRPRGVIGTPFNLSMSSIHITPPPMTGSRTRERDFSHDFLGRTGQEWFKGPVCGSIIGWAKEANGIWTATTNYPAVFQGGRHGADGGFMCVPPEITNLDLTHGLPTGLNLSSMTFGMLSNADAAVALGFGAPSSVTGGIKSGYTVQQDAGDDDFKLYRMDSSGVGTHKIGWGPNGELILNASKGTANYVAICGGDGAATSWGAGSSVGSGLAFFGAGNDGTATLTGGRTEATRDLYYVDLTIPTSHILDMNGFRLFVNGTLTFTDATSVISSDGFAGTSGAGGGAGGAGNTSGTIGGGENGGAGGTNGVNGTAASDSLGGDGGAGEDGGGIPGSGGVATAPTDAEGGVELMKAPPLAQTLHTIGGTQAKGGAGGGGGSGSPGNCGGGGGGGGGCVVVVAKNIVGGGVIRANGGAGAIGQGTGGYGGGGGGGGVVVIYNTKTGNPTFEAAGGASVSGTAGSAGTVEEIENA